MAQRGLRVTVLEQGTLGAEASWAGAGMLSPGGEFDSTSELAAMAVESRRMYPAFVRELTETSGVAIDLQEIGAVDLAYSSDELAQLEEKAARQESIGIESKALTPDRIAAFWPRVRKAGLAGARFYREDGLVNPREVVQALCAVCRGLGVSLIENCSVIELDDRGSSVFLQDKTYDAAVVAAGAWSSGIQVTPQAIPKAWPVKGHLLGYQQPTQTCNTLIRHGHTYLMQRANGFLIVGASVEEVGFDRRIDPEIARKLSVAAGFVMPHLAETTPSETWMGFRPASDTLHLGQWNSGRVYLAYGHYRNGILLAPVTAEKLVAQISANLGTR